MFAKAHDFFFFLFGVEKLRHRIVCYRRRSWAASSFLFFFGWSFRLFLLFFLLVDRQLKSFLFSFLFAPAAALALSSVSGSSPGAGSDVD